MLTAYSCDGHFRSFSELYLFMDPSDTQEKFEDSVFGQPNRHTFAICGDVIKALFGPQERGECRLHVRTTPAEGFKGPLWIPRWLEGQALRMVYILFEGRPFPVHHDGIGEGLDHFLTLHNWFETDLYVRVEAR